MKSLHFDRSCGLILLLLPLLLPCICAQSSLTNTSSPPSNLTIGILAGFSYPSPDPTVTTYPYVQGIERNLSDYSGFGTGPGEYAAIKYQFSVINNRTDILPYTRLIPAPYDDQFVTERGFFGALELIEKRGVNTALLGASSSGPSASAEFVAQSYKLPLLSWAASSPSLANKRSYPNFIRVCQNDAEQGAAMAMIAKWTFGWNEAAIIYTNDPYGSFGAAAFVDAARDNNLTILAEQGFQYNSVQSDVVEPLARIRNSGARIIIYFGQSADWIFSIVPEAHANGMFNNRTVWFVSDAVPADMASFTPDQIALWPGVISIAPDGGSETAIYQQWVTDFINRPVDPIPEETWTGGADDVDFYMVFAADAVNVLAQALHNLIYVQGRNQSWTGDDLFMEMQHIDMQGISGRIRFDSNFDRVGLEFQLLNVQSGNLKVMGTYSQGLYTPLAGAGQVIWYDGTTNVPLSADPLPPPSLPANSLLGPKTYVTFIVLPCICMAFIFVMLAIIFVFRTSRVIHAASPLMLTFVLFGGLLVCVAALLSAFPQAPHLCVAKYWIFNLGFQSAFGSLFLKTWRVHKIFSNEKLVVKALDDWMLLKLLCIGFAFDGLILSLRTGLAPYVLDEHAVCSFESGSHRTIADTFTIILIVTKGCIILAAAWLSYEVRNLPQLYNESSYLAVAIYNVLVLTAAWVGIHYGVDLSDHPVFANVFDHGIMLASAFLALLIVFIPKVVALIISERGLAFHHQIKKQTTLKPSRKSSLDNNNNHNVQLATLGGANRRGSVGGGANAASPPPLGRKDSTGNVAPTAGTVDPVDNILKLLQRVHTDTQTSIDKSLREIKRAEELIATKKKDVLASTDTMFQVQCELDYFADLIKSGMDQEQMIELFEMRLKQFGVTHGGDAGASMIGAGGAVTAGRSILSNTGSVSQLHPTSPSGKVQPRPSVVVGNVQPHGMTSGSDRVSSSPPTSSSSGLNIPIPPPNSVASDLFAPQPVYSIKISSPSTTSVKPTSATKVDDIQLNVSEAPSSAPMDRSTSPSTLKQPPSSSLLVPPSSSRPPVATTGGGGSIPARQLLHPPESRRIRVHLPSPPPPTTDATMPPSNIIRDPSPDSTLVPPPQPMAPYPF